MTRRRWRLLVLLCCAALAGCAGQGTPSTPGHSSVRWPGTVRVPSPLPRALPDDRPVGFAAAIYRAGSGDSDPVLLVTRDGTQYQLPVLGHVPPPPSPVPSPGSTVVYPLPTGAYDVDPAYGLGLSPDGRWLVRTVYGGEGDLVRDLTGIASFHLGRRERVVLWGLSSDVLLLQDFSGDAREQYVEFDPRSLQRTPVAEGACGASYHPIGVHSNGELLCAYFQPAGGADVGMAPGHGRAAASQDNPLLRVVTPSGTVVREVPADPAHPVDVFVEVSGDRLFGLGEAGEAYLLSARTGQVTATFHLPAEQVQSFDVWNWVGFDGRSPVLLRTVEIGSPSPQFEPTQVVLLDPNTGARTVVARFPARSLIALVVGWPLQSVF